MFIYTNLILRQKAAIYTCIYNNYVMGEEGERILI